MKTLPVVVGRVIVETKELECPVACPHCGHDLTLTGALRELRVVYSRAFAHLDKDVIPDVGDASSTDTHDDSLDYLCTEQIDCANCRTPLVAFDQPIKIDEG